MPSLDDESIIPTGVTSRSRRRRKVQTSAAAGADVGEKENIPTKTHRDATDATTTSRSSTNKSRAKATTKETKTTTAKSSRRRKKDYPETTSKSTKPSTAQISSNNNDGCPLLPTWTFSLCESQRDCLSSFQEAFNNASVENESLLKNIDEGLIQEIVEASWSLSPKEQKCTESSSSRLLLHSHSSVLLSTFRKMIKKTTEQQKSKNTAESVLPFLLVAVHGLRALVAIPQATTAQAEAILRLLYHVITMASSTLLTLSETAEPSSSSKRSKNKMEQAGKVCLAAFEALGVVFQRISIETAGSTTTKSKKERITFGIPKDGISSFEALFPIPTITNKSTKKAAAGISISQLLTIATQSMLALCRVLTVLPRTENGILIKLLNACQTSSSAQQPTLNEIIVYLLGTVGLKWAIFIGNHASPDDDESFAIVTKDITSFCKQAHRILWDMAPQAPPKTESASSQEEGFYLRRHAVLVLLGHYSNLETGASGEAVQMENSAILSHLRAKHFENACTLAWKVATSLVQQNDSSRGSSKNILAIYHEEVGAAIDQMAETLEDGMESQPYTDYCAYRALHLGPRATSGATASCCRHKASTKQPCIFSRLPFQYIHKSPIGARRKSQKGNTESPSSVALALMFLSIQIKNQLNHLFLQGGEDHKAKYGLSASNATEIIECFKSTFLNSADTCKVSVAVQLGCFKLISLVPLHTMIFKILNNSSENFTEDSETAEVLEVAADILIKSIGPFAYSILRSETTLDAKKEAFLWDLVVESFCRSAMLYDALGSARGSTEETYHLQRSSDSAMAHLADILLNTITESQNSAEIHLEKAAKILASVGKRRANRNEMQSSLMPLLYSMSLFVRISKEKADSLNQLSSRWSFLASIFQSLGYSYEASLATTAALQGAVAYPSFGIPAESSDGTLVNMLDILVAQTHGVLVMSKANVPQLSNEIKGLARRLLNNCLEKGMAPTASNSTVTTTELGEEEIVEMLIKAVSDRRKGKECVGVEFNLLRLLRSLFYGNSNKNLQHCCGQIQLLVAIIDMLGQKMQKQEPNTDASVTRGMMDLYDALVDLLREVSVALANAARNDTEEAERDIIDSAIQAIIYIVAASCLVSRTELLEVAVMPQFEVSSSPLLSAATRFVEDSWNYVAEEKEEVASEWSLVHSAVRLAAYNMRRNLALANDATVELSNGARGEELATFHESQIQFFSSRESNSDLVDFCRLNFTWTLSKIRDQLSFQGDKLLASQVATWCSSIANYSDGAERKWTEAHTSSLLLAGGMTEVASEMFNNEDEEEAAFDRLAISKALSNIAEAEKLAGRLRLELFRSSSTQTYYHLERQMSNILHDIERLNTPSVVALLASWANASTLFAFAEAANISCDFVKAFSCLRLCFKTCQEILLGCEEEKMALLGEAACIPPWVSKLLPTISMRAREKQVDCLRQTAVLYAKLGDHRKSEAYSISALKSSIRTPKAFQLKSKIKFSDLLAFFRSQIASSSQEHASRQLLLWLKATSTPHDQIIRDLNNVENALSLLPPQADKYSLGGSSGDKKALEIEDFLIVGNLLYGSPGQSMEGAFPEFYERASETYRGFISDDSVCNLSRSLRMHISKLNPERLLSSISHKLRLGEIRSLLDCDSALLEPDTEKHVINWCLDMTRESLVPAECRSWAFYYLGLLELKVARQSGALQKLWKGHSNRESSRDNKRFAVPKCLKDARNYFNSALALLGPASELLSRLALRSLALVTGPENNEEHSAMSACTLIHTSIGGAARQAVYHSLSETDVDKANNTEELLSTKELFGAFDAGFNNISERERKLQSFFDELTTRTPEDWSFVAVTLCPTGEILVARLEKTDSTDELRSEAVCVFPPEPEGKNGTDSLFDNRTYEAMLKPLDILITKSQQQLGGTMTSSEAAEKFKDESKKRSWWKERKSIDENLQSLIESVENDYFSSSWAAQVLFGIYDSAAISSDDSFDSTSSNSCTSDPRGDLTSKFNAVSLDEPNTLARGKQSNQNNAATCSESGCSLLILDESFHRFPFEGMPSFVNRSVCRLPSLAFALSSLRSVSAVDPRQAHYVIDPEANLIETQERLVPFLDELTTRKGWQWEGTVGEIPPREFLKEGLTRENGLVLYCGHGGGQMCFSRSQVESLLKAKVQDTDDASTPSERACRATVVLMGCSSGRLESVNRKGTTSVANLPIFYEPEGIALSYLLAGAPCVVGNLWDVTDHDIDRYCMHLLETFFDSSSCRDARRNLSMADAVNKARSACKMTYINGCAPVCYGIPVQLLNSTSNHRIKR